MSGAVSAVTHHTPQHYKYHSAYCYYHNFY